MTRPLPLLSPAGGEMMSRIQRKDWSTTPLGPVDSWPRALRWAVSVCVPPRFPMCIFWGPELVGIYNDAFISILGGRHPDALGRSVMEVWPEVWDAVRPQFEAVLDRSESTWNERVPMVVERSGFPEEVFFTWSYSPVPGDDGGVGGLLCTVWEETERVRTEAVLAESQRRLDSALIAGEVGTFEWDVPADRLWGDPNFARIFNIQLDETGAAPLAVYVTAIHPEDRDRVMERIRRTVETGDEYEAEYRIISHPQLRWVVARGKTERDSAGRVARFAGVVLDVTERKEAEQALRASKDRYRALFESIDEGFCIIELLFDEQQRPVDYRFVETNPAWEKHTGLRGALGRTAREVIPGLEEHWFEIYGRVALTREAIRFENGSEVMQRWFDVFAFPVDRPEDHRVALLFKDISEQKRVEQALRESRERFRSVLENSLDAAYRRDLRNDRYDYLSPAVEQVLGIEAEEMRRMSVDAYVDRIHPEDRERVLAAIDDGMDRRNGRVEYRIRLETGEYRWVADHFTVQLDSSGSASYRTGIVRDVTDQKLVEEALRRAADVDAFRIALSDVLRPLANPAEIQAEAARVLGRHLAASRVLYAEVVGDAGEAVLRAEYREDGRPSLAGELPLQGFGSRTIEELRAGRSLVVGDVGADERLDPAERTALEAMGIAAYVVVPLRKDGRAVALLTVHLTSPRVWSPAEVSLIEETAERTWEAVERSLAEEERRRSLEDAETARAEAEAANRAKADFLAAMSHDLRTPLNAIGGYVDLLDLGVHGPITEAQRNTLGRIAANQRHLLTLISDILQFAQVEAGRVEFDLRPLDARELLLGIEPLVAPTAAARGIAYSVQPGEPGLSLIGDEERVRQILLNLVGNAIKFTDEGGWVVVSCEADAEWALVSVRDNGTGIAPDKHEVIFQPFVQSDRRLNRPREGVGLGLAISRDLARAMGGDLSVRSTPGDGSSFTLRLPRKRAQTERDAVPVS